MAVDLLLRPRVARQRALVFRVQIEPNTTSSVPFEAATVRILDFSELLEAVSPGCREEVKGVVEHIRCQEKAAIIILFYQFTSADDKVYFELCSPCEIN